MIFSNRGHEQATPIPIIHSGRCNGIRCPEFPKIQGNWPSGSSWKAAFTLSGDSISAAIARNYQSRNKIEFRFMKWRVVYLCCYDSSKNNQKLSLKPKRGKRLKATHSKPPDTLHQQGLSQFIHIKNDDSVFPKQQYTYISSIVF